MQPWRASRAEATFLIGVPLVWAILLLFHPTGDGEDFYPILDDQVTPWMIVHVATLLFIPLLAAVVYLLLRGLDGAAARIARIALASFVLFYTTWEVLIGIGLGVLVDQVNGLAGAQRAAGARVIEDYADSGFISTLEIIGTGSWLVALAATGVALRRQAGVSLAVPALLVLAAVPIAWHVTPFGQVGLALFIAAVLLTLRARSAPGSAATPAHAS
jgi:hypothetical protein